MTFADEAIVFRDLDGTWGQWRLLAGSTDVTRFRGVPATVGQYQLTEPYGYGPAVFSFPQITGFEAGSHGTGALSWFDKGKPLRLVQVDAEGAIVRTIWRGFMSLITPGREGTEVQCDGEASGRLALRDKHAELFFWFKDASHLIYEAFRAARIPSSPTYGLDTGILIDERGRVGTLLSYCDELLALAQNDDGDQLTIMPDANGVYVQQWKDRATVDATVFYGAHGIDLDVSTDLAEEPTTYYGSGRTPDGMLWVNGKYPGLQQGTIPAFPGTLELGDTGEDVEVLQLKLRGMGYLDADDAAGGFNAATVQAVKDLQDDAGLSQTGIVSEATWNALFNLADTGFSLKHARVHPLAQLSAVRLHNLTSNGSVIGWNDNYDPTRIEVDRTVDFGVMRKKRARRWSQGELSRVQSGKNWAGTLTMTTDAFAGDYDHGGLSPAALSRLDLDAGMNIKVRDFDGDTLFHVSAITVTGTAQGFEARLAVDTKARDALTLAQIVERNRATRTWPARSWLNERRRTGANQQAIQWTEIGGLLDTKVVCSPNTWNVFPVVVGQSGSVAAIRVKVEDSACEFVVGITAKRTSRAWWVDKVGNPFSGNRWESEKVRAQIEDTRILLAAFGDNDQPGGYYPGRKTGDDGEATGDSLTGVLLDGAGFDYWTFDQPVLWVAVYPKELCVIKPQQILWPTQESGM